MYKIATDDQSFDMLTYACIPNVTLGLDNSMLLLPSSCHLFYSLLQVPFVKTNHTPSLCLNNNKNTSSIFGPFIHSPTLEILAARGIGCFHSPTPRKPLLRLNRAGQNRVENH
jgi:hypothetical protein